MFLSRVLQGYILLSKGEFYDKECFEKQTYLSFIDRMSLEIIRTI